MRKLLWLIFVLTVGAGLYVYRLSRLAPPAGQAPLTQDAKPINAPPAQKESLSGLAKHAPLDPGAVPTNLTDAPPECAASWTRVLESDFNGYLQAVAAGRADRSPECSQWERAHYTKGFGAMPADACFDAKTLDPYLNPAQPGKLPKEIASCISQITFYRSWIMAQATKTMSADQMSPTLLANKIFARFADLNDDPKATADIRVWNDALMKKDPDLYAAHKLDLALELLGPKIDYEALARKVERINRFGQTDPEVQAVELLEIADREGVEAVSRRLEEFAAQSPEDPRWEYYRGYVAWKQGDGKAAVAAIKRAQARDPKNKDYEKTLSEIPKHKPGDKNVFTLSVGFNFQEL